MDTLVRKIEVPLAKRAVSDAGLYIAAGKDMERLAQIAMEACREYPLHNWFTNGRYDCEASKRIMEVSLLDFCDRENIVCYLETNKQSNVSLYQHFEFQLSEQGLIPGSNVMHYAMARPPQTIQSGMD